MDLLVAIEVRDGGRGEDRAARFVSANGEVLVLADGAGGVGLGAFAAECVVRAAQKLAHGTFGSASEALEDVDAELSRHGCMSTGVIVEVHDGMISGASCGDSVAWLISGETVLELTERQFRKPLLGSGGVPMRFEGTEFQGTLMLATDGLVNYVGRRAIVAAALAGDVSASAVALAELPRMRSGGYQDDVAVVVSRANA